MRYHDARTAARAFAWMRDRLIPDNSCSPQLHTHLDEPHELVHHVAVAAHKTAQVQTRLRFVQTSVLDREPRMLVAAVRRAAASASEVAG